MSDTTTPRQGKPDRLPFLCLALCSLSTALAAYTAWASHETAEAATKAAGEAFWAAHSAERAHQDALTFYRSLK